MKVCMGIYATYNYYSYVATAFLFARRIPHDVHIVRLVPAPLFAGVNHTLSREIVFKKDILKGDRWQWFFNLVTHCTSYWSWFAIAERNCVSARRRTHYRCVIVLQDYDRINFFFWAQPTSKFHVGKPMRLDEFS